MRVGYNAGVSVELDGVKAQNVALIPKVERCHHIEHRCSKQPAPPPGSPTCSPSPLRFVWILLFLHPVWPRTAPTAQCRPPTCRKISRHMPPRSRIPQIRTGHVCYVQPDANSPWLDVPEHVGQQHCSRLAMHGQHAVIHPVRSLNLVTCHGPQRGHVTGRPRPTEQNACCYCGSAQFKPRTTNHPLLPS
eukprot:1789967-Rhodomonas_salina.2